MVGFRNLVGTGIAPVSKKTAVKFEVRMNVKKVHSIAWGYRYEAVSKKRKQTSFPHKKITPSTFFPVHRRHFYLILLIS